MAGKCRGKSTQLGNSSPSHLLSGLPEEFLGPALLLVQLRVQHCWDRIRDEAPAGTVPRKDPKNVNAVFFLLFS